MVEESVKTKSQLTKNLFSLAVVQVATYVLPLLSVPIISRILGPEKFGLINFGAAYVAYFTILITYSFDFTATRKISKQPDDVDNRNRVFTDVFFTQCLLFVLATILFSVLLLTIPELQKNQGILIASYSLCVSTLFTQNWIFQAMQDLAKVALFNITSKILFTIAIVLVVQKNEDYIWQPLLIGIIQGSIAIWSFFWAIKRYQIKIGKPSLTKCWAVLKEDRIIFFSLICVSLYTYTNTVILGLFQSAEQVGYYTAAQRLIIIAQSVLVMPLAQAFYPYVGKAFGESKALGLTVAQKLIPLIALFLGLAAIGMFFLGPYVIRAFYGERFESAITVFQILSVVPLFYALNNVLGIQIMVNLGMDKQFLYISAAAGIMSVVFNLLIVKRFGFVGTTVTWLCTEVFLFITMCLVLKRAKLNPINLEYFKLSAIKEYANPLLDKFKPVIHMVSRKLNRSTR